MGQVLTPLTNWCIFHPCLILAGILALSIVLCIQPARPEVHFDRSRVVRLRGEVATAPLRLDRSLYLELSVLSIRQDGKMIDYPGRVAVYIYSTENSEQYFMPPLAYGDALRLKVYLEEPPHYGIPGVPDFRELFWQKGILHLVRIKSYRQIQRTKPAALWTPKGGLFRYRRGFAEFCRDNYEPATQKLILNILFGQHRLLGEAEKRKLKRLGVFHLFVVSGFHVAVLVFFLHYLLYPLGPIGKLLVLVGVWCYIVLAGGTLPTVRAGLMGSCSYLLLAFGISQRFLNCLGIAALFTLITSPVSLYSASFQFSYLSLLAIGIFALPRQPTLRSLWLAWRDVFSDQVVPVPGSQGMRRRHTRYLLEAALEPLPRRFIIPCLRIGARVLAYLLALAICSCFVQLATLPLSLYYSNLWIWTQGLANLILVPCFALFLLGSLILFATYWLPLVSALATALGVLARGLDQLIEGLASMALVSYLPRPGSVMIGLYFLLLSCCCWHTRKLRMLAWMSPGVLLLPSLPSPSQANPLQVTVLDVGQGESIHLRYPNGEHALIDTGGSWSLAPESSQFVGERLVAPYLWQQGCRRLAYVLLTHPHADHIQGYEFLKQAFPIEEVLYSDPRRSYFTSPHRQLAAGDRFVHGGVHHWVLHPPPGQLDAYSALDANDRSVVVLLRYGQFSMLFTGDVTATVERKLAQRLPGITVLKAAHHGSASSSARVLLDVIRPTVALISAGRRNAFGHPATSTLARLRDSGIITLSTSRLGSLRIETDGKQWRALHYSMPEKQFCRILGGGK